MENKNVFVLIKDVTINRTYSNASREITVFSTYDAAYKSMKRQYEQILNAYNCLYPDPSMKTIDNHINDEQAVITNNNREDRYEWNIYDRDCAK